MLESRTPLYANNQIQRRTVEQKNQEMQDPLISVIIPVYNVAPYLREAVDSAVNQTYRNLEIIMVDDGSTDGSGDICDEYASRDPRITVIHQKNCGVSSARNAGLDRATGEYIAFLDSDDAYDLSFIRTMIDVAFRENSDIVECLHCKFYTKKKMSLSVEPNAIHSSYPTIKPGRYSRNEALVALVDRSLGIVVWNKLYKMKLWKNCRFSVKCIVMEDMVANLNVFDQCNSVYLTDHLLYYYRKRPGSITTINSEKNIRGKVFSLHYVEKYVEAHTPEIFSEEYLIQYKQRLMRFLIRNYTYVEDPGMLKEMKDQAITLTDQIGIANCGIKMRAGCHMMRLCPWLIKILYPIYHQIRLWVRVTGR